MKKHPLYVHFRGGEREKLSCVLLSFHLKTRRSFHLKTRRSFHLKTRRSFHLKTRRSFHLKTRRSFYLKTRRSFRLKTRRSFHLKTRRSLNIIKEQPLQANQPKNRVATTGQMSNTAHSVVTLSGGRHHSLCGNTFKWATPLTLWQHFQVGNTTHAANICKTGTPWLVVLIKYSPFYGSAKWLVRPVVATLMSCLFRDRETMHGLHIRSTFSSDNFNKSFHTRPPLQLPLSATLNAIHMTIQGFRQILF